MSQRLEDRVLVLAPTGRDAAMIASALTEVGLPVAPCLSMPLICAELNSGAGAVLVTEEALDDLALAELGRFLNAQEPWSDLPIVLLGGRAFTESSDRAGRLLTALRNVTVLERPVRVGVLIAAVQAAVRARRRQYDLRRELARREQDALERAEMLRAEQKARRDAEAANRLKDEFLATVSHELRTPVNVILGWSGMLIRGASVEGQPEDRRQHAIEVIHRNAHAQAHVIEELLDVSRIITGKLRMDPSPVALVPLLQEAIDAVRPAIEGKNITVESEWAESVPTIWGDDDRLRQVFWNLLANAVKFTPHGGRLCVRVARTDGHVEVRVADNGIGIAPHVLPFVFDRFRQADSTATREHGGLGLGLAIVRQLVEMHGGAVSAHSDGPGRGAEFVVRLPIGRRIENAPYAAQSPSSASDGRGQLPRLDGVSILVVDDDADGREMVAELLQGQGAIVRTSRSGTEAINAVPAFKPDVILADIAMPGLDGYELLERIRETVPADAMPRAIALTAYARAEDKARAFAAGYSAHVPKPVDAHLLVRTIRQLSPTHA
jgi:signal transduction histidine kinase/CheY-like chemotaxis protein